MLSSTAFPRRLHHKRSKLYFYKQFVKLVAVAFIICIDSFITRVARDEILVRLVSVWRDSQETR